MNLTVPAAAAALETAFLDMLREGAGGFGAFESEARSVALSCCAEAMSRALVPGHLRGRRAVRPPAPTRWRGCAAGSGRGSRCLPAPASRSSPRGAGSGGSASSRGTLPGGPAGA